MDDQHPSQLRISKEVIALEDYDINEFNIFWIEMIIFCIISNIKYLIIIMNIFYRNIRYIMLNPILISNLKQISLIEKKWKKSLGDLDATEKNN